MNVLIYFIVIFDNSQDNPTPTHKHTNRSKCTLLNTVVCKLLSSFALLAGGFYISRLLFRILDHSDILDVHEKVFVLAVQDYDYDANHHKQQDLPHRKGCKVNYIIVAFLYRLPFQVTIRIGAHR